MTTNNSPDDLGILPPQAMPVGLHYYPEAITNCVHHFYLSGDIGPPVHYVEMIHIIRSASPDDVVHIHLNSTGGHLDTGIQIVNAMNESNAHIVCSIEAQAYSMASLIFLSADSFIVHDNSILMIHNFSGGTMGKGNEQRLRLDAMTTLFERFSRPLYVPFITNEEFDGVLEGKDIWFLTDEIKERLSRCAKPVEEVSEQSDDGITENHEVVDSD